MRSAAARGPRLHTTVAPGTQSGRLVRMRGRGQPHQQGTNKGDLIIRVNVWTPTQLTPEQEAVMRQLARVESPPERVDDRSDRGFWSRVKEALTGS